MADDAKELEIVIRTTAELDGARAVETQLERNIAQAEALGKVLPHGQMLPHGPGMEEPREDIRPADTDTPTGQTLPPGQGLPQSERTEVPWDDDGQTGVTPGSEKEGITEPVIGDMAAERLDDSSGDPLTQPSPPLGEREEPVVADHHAGSFSAGEAFPTEAALEPQINAQTQATQAAGEKLRAALERNGQATVSLLNRTLELMEQQNRRLGETERRVAELAGQIKSSRNP